LSPVRAPRRKDVTVLDLEIEAVLGAFRRCLRRVLEQCPSCLFPKKLLLSL
jgi:hypothetical protein